MLLLMWPQISIGTTVFATDAADVAVGVRCDGMIRRVYVGSQGRKEGKGDGAQRAERRRKRIHNGEGTERRGNGE